MFHELLEKKPDCDFRSKNNARHMTKAVSVVEISEQSLLRRSHSSHKTIDRTLLWVRETYERLDRGKESMSWVAELSGLKLTISLASQKLCFPSPYLIYKYLTSHSPIFHVFLSFLIVTGLVQPTLPRLNIIKSDQLLLLPRLDSHLSSGFPFYMLFTSIHSGLRVICSVLGTRVPPCRVVFGPLGLATHLPFCLKVYSDA